MFCRGYLPTGLSCAGVFYDFKHDWFTGKERDCADLFDGDIAGIGVIIAFILSVVITTTASICAALIDFRVGTKSGLIPLNSRLLLATDDRRVLRLRMWRKVLDRLILGFADQQIVTGFALLIIAYIKLTPRHYILPGFGREWLEIANGKFALVVFLCIASSSSHLACLMVLNDYFTKHKAMEYLRVGLVASFSVLLTVTVAIASSFTGYLYMIAYYATAPMSDDTSAARMQLVVAFVLGVPLTTMFYLFWICTLQLLPDVRGWLRQWLSTKVFVPLCRRLRVQLLWQWLTNRMTSQRRTSAVQALKSVGWTCILGNRSLVYTIQLAMAVLSVTWILLQRFSAVPKGYDGHLRPLCSMSEAAQSHEVWSFGQMLPLFLLSLPLLAAWELYVEERENLRLEILVQDDNSRASSIASGVASGSGSTGLALSTVAPSSAGGRHGAPPMAASFKQRVHVKPDDTNSHLDLDDPDDPIK